MNEVPLTPSPVLGEVIVDQLIRMRVRDAVIAPGSRNAPLTMALWRASERGEIRLHTRIDERSAAFLALGISKATGIPTPVICTSGSAAANFYPALLEAHHSALPLIAITADRPARLWQSGANQTTRQLNMFPAAIDQTLNLAVQSNSPGEVQRWRSAIASAVRLDKPTHINVEFDEPLVGSLDWIEDISFDVPLPAQFELHQEPLQKYAQHGVIVVGHD
ncbi:MAG: 2-succinyl-5-enolpyruvyl-6-hydroxy-3-cyclohexene-1-carboxylate synthase, partial [Actinobacteria bacterium]|nr:2-succinyl-5-enolpyruvyl-6-hydroxy-3-cyclohexene-1-carboxylate synthase [Actinomycetota bacterium]